MQANGAGARERMKTWLHNPWLRAVVRLAVSIVLLGILLAQVDSQRLAEHLQQLSFGFVLAAWGYYALCQFLSSYRWQMFLTAKNIHVPVTTLFSYYMIGMFFNNFLPGSVGGDVAKAYYVYQRTPQGPYALGSVFLERFSGLLGLSVMSVIALAIALPRTHAPMILASVGGTALFLLAVVLALWWAPLSPPIQKALGRIFPASIGPRLQQFYRALASYRQHPGTLLQAVALSVVIQGLYALYYGFVSWGLGISIDLYYFLLFLPLVTLVTLAPISFGGWGVREALMVFLFSQAGVEAADILAVSLTGHLLNTLLSVSGAFFWLRHQRGPRPSQGQKDQGWRTEVVRASRAESRHAPLE